MTCWYCNNGKRPKIIKPEHGGAYLLCKCGATTVPGLANLKVRRNVRGGIAGIVFSRK